jgi:predicted transcriptional regulator
VDREQIENIALLSIHPKYAHSILNGDKLVEFRKTKFKKPVKYCLIYSTSPDQKIIGFFEIKKIEEN